MSKLLVAGAVMLSCTISSVGYGQTPAEKKEALNTMRRAATWRFSRSLSMLAILRAEKAPKKILDSMQRDVDKLGKALRLKVPEMPKLTGDRIKDLAHALGYLLRTAGPSIGRKLRSYGTEHPAIFELAVKSSILAVLYIGKPNDKIVAAAREAVKVSGKRTGIPSRLWNPMVSASEKTMAQKEFKRRVFSAQSAIQRHLKKESDEAFQVFRR